MSLEVGKDFGRVQTGDSYETRLEERQYDAVGPENSSGCLGVDWRWKDKLERTNPPGAGLCPGTTRSE